MVTMPITIDSLMRVGVRSAETCTGTITAHLPRGRTQRVQLLTQSSFIQLIEMNGHEALPYPRLTEMLAQMCTPEGKSE